ncbi:MAG: cytochrome P450 [Sphingomonadales bacterium]|nr:cytochrome P450 [Sphingomonadales bacterium]
MADSEPDFFTDPAVIDDPRSYFAAMRGRCPVMTEAYQNSLMVTGYDEVKEVLDRRDDTFSTCVNVLGPVPGLPFTPEGDDIRAQVDAHREEMPWSAHLTAHDGARHAASRQLLTDLLTYKRLKANEDYLHGLAENLIAGFIDRRECNAATEYAHAAATYAISDIMGIPREDRAELVALLGAPPSQLEGEAVHRVGADPLIFLKERFDGYFRDRQAEPRGDLMTELLQAKFRDGGAPDFDTVSLLARFLFGAGQDTTSRLIAMAIRILADDPELQQRLRAEPARIADFLEEVLRFDGPVKVVYRLAQKRTEVAGVDVPAGTVLTVSLTGASNDPRHFDEPDRFDIDRPNKRDHLGFSRGVHACLGAPLARLEARVAIDRILARTSSIRLAEAHHGPRGARRFRFEQTYTFRSLSDLFIEFDPA